MVDMQGFKERLASRISEGKQHGVTDDLMAEGIVNLTDIAVSFFSADKPEERLMKDLWEISTEEEKKMMSGLLLRYGKQALH
ncbi:DUF3243 family protein [Heliophilum fasciatum]|uniref:Uncharacterized protein DUF3243 n=1 Tax=Heliophilum fasciatum TaxID=35700 RepID=A0A4R2RXG1_9FIRM|nr:DUF3243 family protein [Heliophilum fasciatum]MCW2277181.1 hypothetical protein [Heliophilum fasciatum]TCP68184.1 uncharacterized protein DUF3243 [Heliophilum fasciatum]